MKRLLADLIFAICALLAFASGLCLLLLVSGSWGGWNLWPFVILAIAGLALGVLGAHVRLKRGS